MSRFGVLYVLAPFLLCAGCGAESIENSPLVAQFLVLGVLFSLALVIGMLLSRFQSIPSLIWPLLAAVVLGPSVFGRIAPQMKEMFLTETSPFWGMLDNGGQLALLIVLLDAGLSVKCKAAWHERRTAMSVGVIGVVIPFALLAVSWTFLFPQFRREDLLGDPDKLLGFALYNGLAGSISAIIVIAVVLKEKGLRGSDLGLRIILGYAVNDLVAWVAFSIAGAIVRGGAVSPWIVFELILFSSMIVAGYIGVGVPLANRFLAFAHATEHRTHLVPLAVLAVSYLSGALVESVGLSYFFGYFLAGLVFGQDEQYSTSIEEFLREAARFLVPVYFLGIGLRHDFVGSFELLVVLSVTFLAIVGKLWGAWVGAYVAGHNAADRWPLAVAFIVGGVPTIIVAEEAVKLGVFSDTMLVAYVYSVVISAVLVGPWLDWATKPTSADLQEAPTNVVGVEIGWYFHDAAVIEELSSGDREGAIAEVCDRLSAITGIPSLVLAKEVLERESTESTSVAPGVALPHATVEGLKQTIIAVARSHGIDWPGAAGGQPVRLLFLLLFPSGDAVHNLQVHARLTRALGKEDLANLLLHEPDREGMIRVLQQMVLSSGRKSV